MAIDDQINRKGTMMENAVKPDKKYYTKCVFILLTVTAIMLIVTGVIHLIIHLASGNDEAIAIIWIICPGVIVIMWIISYPILSLWIKNLTYYIHDDRVTIQKGILTKTQQNIPYRSITDFALERTIYDRVLKIGSVKIQTAGQSHSPTGYEGKLAGLIAYETLYADLKEKIKHLHRGFDSLNADELQNENNEPILNQILAEIKAIRRNMEKE
jgi:uncharacterized membrane protein YdbT with pleckstrin-like domain